MPYCLLAGSLPWLSLRSHEDFGWFDPQTRVRMGDGQCLGKRDEHPQRSAGIGQKPTAVSLDNVVP